MSYIDLVNEFPSAGLQPYDDHYVRTFLWTCRKHDHFLQHYCRMWGRHAHRSISFSRFCSSRMQVAFLGLLLTDVASKHMHLTWIAMFQAKIVSHSAATEASSVPDVILGTSSRRQLQTPGQEDGPLYCYYWYLPIKSINFQLKAQRSSFNNHWPIEKQWHKVVLH